METTIIALRHGETEWNKIERQQGHLNSNLTALGEKQARAMADALKSYELDCFYSSDLGRAVQTSVIISEIIGRPFTLEPRFRERNLGILQGLTKKEFAEKYPADSEKMKSNDPDYRIPGGESVRDRFNRCIIAAEEIAQRHCGKTIVIVAHGGVLMSFIHKALEIPLSSKRHYSLLNGSINSFTVDQDFRWKLQRWGEVSHLKRFGLDALDDT